MVREEEKKGKSQRREEECQVQACEAVSCRRLHLAALSSGTASVEARCRLSSAWSWETGMATFHFTLCLSCVAAISAFSSVRHIRSSTADGRSSAAVTRLQL